MHSLKVILVIGLLSLSLAQVNYNPYVNIFPVNNTAESSELY